MIPKHIKRGHFYSCPVTVAIPATQGMLAVCAEDPEWS